MAPPAQRAGQPYVVHGIQIGNEIELLQYLANVIGPEPVALASAHPIEAPAQH